MKSKVVGVGIICRALSCGGGSCAVVCDATTVALKGVGGVRNEPVMVVFVSKVVGDGIY